MTTAIVHRTPGLLDPRSFTLMGVSAKPGTTNPIGMFGTGLKYAIATLVRLGAEVTIWIGRDQYVFEKRPGEFRGQEIEHLVFRRLLFGRVRWTKHDLPFTTSYGKFWQPWMAFRELHSNTLDECGVTWLAEHVDGNGWSVESECDQEGSIFEMAHPEYTTIVVRHPEYEQAFRTMDEIFLPGATRELRRSQGVEVMERGEDEASRLYYRGLRVYDLPKPSLHTYNFVCEMTLTEDRTLGNVYAARNVLAGAVLRSDDEDFVHSIVTASEDTWEHGLEFPSWVEPGEAFRSVMRRRDRRGYSPSAVSYFGRYADPPPAARQKSADQLLDDYPGPWRVVDDRIVDDNDKDVVRQPQHMDTDDWELLALAIIQRCRKGRSAEEQVAEAVDEINKREASAAALGMDAPAPALDEEIPF